MVLVVHLWDTCGALVVHLWCTCGAVVVYLWYSSDSFSSLLSFCSSSSGVSKVIKSANKKLNMLETELAKMNSEEQTLQTNRCEYVNQAAKHYGSTVTLSPYDECSALVSCFLLFLLFFGPIYRPID